MGKSAEEIAFEINQSDRNLIFLVGNLSNFKTFNLANDYNYSYYVFDTFLKENNIDPESLSSSTTMNNSDFSIKIDLWTQKIAYLKQKSIIIIDQFNPKKIESLLLRSLFLQELIHLSKNDHKLAAKLVFAVDTSKYSLVDKIMTKVLEKSKIIKY